MLTFIIAYEISPFHLCGTHTVQGFSKVELQGRPQGSSPHIIGYPRPYNDYDYLAEPQLSKSPGTYMYSYNSDYAPSTCEPQFWLTMPVAVVS